MSQFDVTASNLGWVCDSITQQIKEQDSKPSGSSDMSDYEELKESTMIDTVAESSNWLIE